jgi:hypothetical protein
VAWVVPQYVAHAACLVRTVLYTSAATATTHPVAFSGVSLTCQMRGLPAATGGLRQILVESKGWRNVRFIILNTLAVFSQRKTLRECCFVENTSSETSGITNSFSENDLHRVFVQ